MAKYKCPKCGMEYDALGKCAIVIAKFGMVKRIIIPVLVLAAVHGF